MTGIQTQTRAERAIARLAQNRLEARMLLGVYSPEASGGESGTFPRSRTVRWLLRHPVGRWIGSALLATALGRLPFGKILSMHLLSGRS